ALVFLVLVLFLRFRMAFWISLGIPASFLGALWLMPALGSSINMISLFAFILVLGIVVDDAIVVGENIYTHQQRGKPWLQASIDGTHEVAVPVIFAVLTTIVAFIPLLMVAGVTGKIWKIIPLVVIPTLIFSLIESQLVLPAHLSRRWRLARADEETPRLRFSGWIRFQRAFERGLDWFIENMYRPGLAWALHWRYVTVSTFIAVFLLTLGLVFGGWVKFVFMPNVEADYAVAMLTMPQGTPADVTAKAVAQLEHSALALREEIEGGRDDAQREVFRHIMGVIGEQPYRVAQRLNMGQAGVVFAGSNLGEVTIELVLSEQRTMSSEEIVERWRALTGSIPDAVELTYTSSLFAPGEDINVQLSGPDIEELRHAAGVLKARLNTYAGVNEVTDSFREGAQEIKLAITPAAETLGLTLANLGRQVRQGFYGEEAQRIQRGRDDVRVMVRYPADHRRSLGDLETMRIRTPAGDEVPFSSVAVAEIGRGPATINRVDRLRVINVTADVDTTTTDTSAIVSELVDRWLPELMAEHRGLRYSFEGQQREQKESLEALIRGFMYAVIAIFALMAIPLRSYVQPLIIISAIPFGIVGAVMGHIVIGMALSILSLVGIVALAGVVVNDNLVLVDFINRSRASGRSIFEAVYQAGVARFRPILLTSLTTFFGLLPMLMEKSVQAQFLIPMAATLGFGVMFATFISLLLVPSLYLVLEDVKGMVGRVVGRTSLELKGEDA
ncbi:MAG TPA: efflux RND transporter permease subunit, partial [Nitrospirales bacterium]|nr:efflux RND transporter permease subunit [Nitrospirales bacterium]